MIGVSALVARLQQYAERPADDLDPANAPPVGLTTTQLGLAAQAVADELIALQAIYGDESVALLTVERTRNGGLKTTVIDEEMPNAGTDTFLAEWDAFSQPIRLTVKVDLALSDPVSGTDDNATVRLSAVLPVGYPIAPTPPQLQLLSRYVGAHGVDHTLFGQILRLYMLTSEDDDQDNSVSMNCVHYRQGQVALFDGLEKARELIEAWYTSKEEVRLQRKSDASQLSPVRREDAWTATSAVAQKRAQVDQAPIASVRLVSAPAITERKSTFVGHAAPLSDPHDVPAILSGLLQDRRISRATHPAMYAWVCRSSPSDQSGPGASAVVHRDCDDDGEHAAGGRLAHLLDVLHLHNAIVIVTRWYGGVHLGADRFKLINRAARDALELAKLVSGPLHPVDTADKGRDCTTK